LQAVNIIPNQRTTFPKRGLLPTLAETPKTMANRFDKSVHTALPEKSGTAASNRMYRKVRHVCNNAPSHSARADEANAALFHQVGVIVPPNSAWRMPGCRIQCEKTVAASLAI
jgi:hypothetical protein